MILSIWCALTLYFYIDIFKDNQYDLIGDIIVKRIVFGMVLLVLMGFLFSCGTFPGPSAVKPFRPLPDSRKTAVFDTVETRFIIRNTPGYLEDNKVISNAGYVELLNIAKKKHGDNVDVFDIVWTETGRKWIQKFGSDTPEWSNRWDINTSNWLGNEFSVTGKVVTLNTQSYAGIEGALVKAATDATKNVPKNVSIAIVYITAQDQGIVYYIAGELEFILVRDGYIISDRSQLNLIRQEQNFQINGEVDDNSAVSIGKILGARVLITGKLEGIDQLRRLRLRVLDVQTGQVIGVASEQM